MLTNRSLSILPIVKRGKIVKRLTVQKYNCLGIKSASGLPCDHYAIKSFVEHVTVHSNKGFCHLQYLAVSLANHPLLQGVLTIGERRLKGSKSMRKVKCIWKL